MSDSVRPHRRQPTWLPHPWDSPGQFSDQGSNPGALHWKFQCLSHQTTMEIPRFIQNAFFSTICINTLLRSFALSNTPGIVLEAKYLYTGCYLIPEMFLTCSPYVMISNKNDQCIHSISLVFAKLFAKEKRKKNTMHYLMILIMQIKTEVLN